MLKLTLKAILPLPSEEANRRRGSCVELPEGEGESPKGEEGMRRPSQVLSLIIHLCVHYILETSSFIWILALLNSTVHRPCREG